MSAKVFASVFKIILAAAFLFSSLAFASPAAAQNTCGDRYTVVRGDTLRKIAASCRTSMAAIQRANPEIKNANLISVGQVLLMPGALLPGTGSEDVYIVNKGDSLVKLAARFNTTVDRLLTLNTAITNRNLIYEGQRLSVPNSRTPLPTPVPVPTPGQTYTVIRGDTLRIIAARFGVTVDDILRLNPDIKNPNIISVGQKIVLPSVVTSYTVVRGDTLRTIASRYNTTVTKLLELNPVIKNADLIFPGQVIKIR
jgi:LysM repeat protein